jgi:hypothetical protein
MRSEHREQCEPSLDSAASWKTGVSTSRAKTSNQAASGMVPGSGVYVTDALTATARLTRFPRRLGAFKDHQTDATPSWVCLDNKEAVKDD